MNMTTRLRPFLALVRKDLHVFLSDRRAVILAFLVPLLLASVFASIGGGGGGEGGSKIPVLVVDLDRTRLSAALVDGLAGDKNLNVGKADTAEAARARVRRGDPGVAVVIPKGFADLAPKGFFRPDLKKPELTFLSDPTHAAESGMVRGVLTQHAMEVVSREAFGGPGGLSALDDAEKSLESEAGLPTPLRDALRSMFREVRKVRDATADAEGPAAAGSGAGGAGGGFGMASPFDVKEETVAAPGQVNAGLVAAHAFAGMTVQFILFGAIEAGVGLLLERQKGLWRRVRAAPLGRMTVLGAKAVSQALISLAIIAVLYAFGMALFRVRFLGSVPGFVLVAAGYALTASAFGLLVAALGKTPQAARGVSILAVLLMVLLGGAWMPMFLFPSWVQTVTLALPTRWAVDGLEGATWRGLGFTELLPHAVALFGFAAVFGLLAVARFRWEED
jgi:ABC-2 type transport system permease protein